MSIDDSTPSFKNRGHQKESQKVKNCILVSVKSVLISFDLYAFMSEILTKILVELNITVIKINEI